VFITVSKLRTSPKLTLLLEVIENLKHCLCLQAEYSKITFKVARSHVNGRLSLSIVSGVHIELLICKRRLFA